MKTKALRVLKNKKVVIIAPIIIIIIALIIYLSLPKKPEYEFAVAKIGDINQEVSATGNIVPMEAVDLAFEKSARIIRVSVEIGDRIYSGEVLASTDDSELIAQLNQALANLDSQKATLEELKAGTRPEQIKIHESDLKKSQQDLKNYYSSVIDILSDAYNKASDAVLNQTANIYTNTDTDNPKLTIIVSNSQTEVDTTWQRTQVKYELSAWQKELSIIKTSQTEQNLDVAIQNSQKHLTTVRTFLNKTMDALDNSIGVPSATLATYKTSVNTGLTNINTVLINTNAQQQLIASQKFVVEKAQNQLAFDLSGNTPETIAAQEALVKQAEANVQNYRAQISKTKIYSPFNGIVSKVDIKVGEISSPAITAIALISDAKFKIETNIAEADIASVKIGDLARITLDAYGNDVVFKAKVVKIDPAETVIEGVSTYKTTLQLIEKEDKIKSGMTANIDIKTAEKNNVLIIPQRVVKTADGEKFVQLLDPQTNAPKEIKIKTGLRGSDGNIEIIEGLKEGDKIIISR